MNTAPENLNDEALGKTCVSPAIVRGGRLCDNSVEMDIEGEKGGKESGCNGLKRLPRVGETEFVGIGWKQLGRVSALKLVALDELAQGYESGVDAGSVSAGKEFGDGVEQTGPLGGKVDENEPAGGLCEDALDIGSTDDGESVENVVAEALAGGFG